MEFQFTDAGRSLSLHASESNDCAVRSIAVAFPMAYGTAHGLLNGFGREDGQPFSIVEFGKNMGFECLKYVRAMDLSTGSWIVETKNHYYPLVDGVVYDEVDARDDRIHYVWRVV